MGWRRGLTLSHFAQVLPISFECFLLKCQFYAVSQYQNKKLLISKGHVLKWGIFILLRLSQIPALWRVLNICSCPVLNIYSCAGIYLVSLLNNEVNEGVMWADFHVTLSPFIPSPPMGFLLDSCQSLSHPPPQVREGRASQCFNKNRTHFKALPKALHPVLNWQRELGS